MSIYIIATVTPLIFSFFKKISIKAGTSKKYDFNTVAVIFLGVMYFIISAFRADSVGNDLIRYVSRYQMVGRTPWHNIFNLGDTWGFEVGFVFLCKLLSIFTLNPRILVVVSSFIIVGSFYRTIIKYSENALISMYLFNLFGFFVTSLNLMRLFLAVAICLWSIEYVEQKKFLKFVLIVIIASLFHTSAIVFLVVYFAPSIKINKTTFVLSAIFCIVSFFFSKQITLLMTYVFSENYSGYRGEIGSGSGNGLLILLIGIFIFAYISFDREDRKDEVLTLWINLLFITIVLNILATRLSSVSRLMWYFKISLIFLIPHISNVAKKKSYNFNFCVFQIISNIAPWYFYYAMLSSPYLAVTPYILGEF